MSHFFAFLSRMKLIQRWALMHNTRQENVQEHSLEVAILSHALAVIGNKYFEKKYNAERVGILAVFHDASEVFTGDMPTPVKYASVKLKEAYKEIEDGAVNKLLNLLPADLKPDYESLLIKQDSEKDLWRLVKAADSLSAYIKCLQECSHGNKEFNRAKIIIEQNLKSMKMVEVDYFLRNFLHSFSLSLDELSL